MPQVLIEPQDTVTLVPNQIGLDLRLAEKFRAREEGMQSFWAPPIFLLSAWAEDLSRRASYLRGEAAPAVPGRTILQRTWEAVIEADRQDLLPAERRTLAAQAMGADRLLQQWTHADRDLRGGRAWQRFLRWRSDVHRTLADNAWMTPEQQLARLRRQIAAGEISGSLLPDRIVLDGFAELTRVEGDLLDALAAVGVGIAPGVLPNLEPDEPRLLRCAGLEDEMNLAARWARAQVASGAISVGVIVNGLDAIGEQLRRAFENIFQAESLLAFSSSENSAFHLREGMALSAHPLVSSALALLELSSRQPGDPQRFPQVSQWLLSPAWAGADHERFARAALEHHLRRRGAFRWSLEQVADEALGFEVAELRARLRQCPEPAPGVPTGAQFRDWLAHWGWPGPLPRDARAERAVQHFLRHLRILERAEGIGIREAMDTLRHLCGSDRLGAGGGALSPVQILSPEDAFGCRFGAVRLVNVHSGNWPGPVRQNPLLPAAVNEQIPRVHAQGLLAYTRRLHQAVLKCAPSVSCSWSSAQGGVPRSRSALLTSGRIADESAVESASLADTVFPAVAELNGYGCHPWLEAVPAHRGVPLRHDERSLRRALDVVQLQFACPFAAYLVHRLQAGFEAPPAAFPDAAFTGMLLHRALERLYRPHLGAGTRPTLAEASAAAEAALGDSRAGRRLPPVALAAERQRLSTLLVEWLEAESQRRTGVPVALEHMLSGALSGFDIEVRVDRIDHLEDGRCFVLDYKSGSLPAVRWDTERLTQPQLPLYAVLLTKNGDSPAGGVALASVRSGQIALKGLSDIDSLCGCGVEGFTESGPLARRFDSWAAVLRHWEKALANALDEYRRGDASHLVHFDTPLRYLGLNLLLQDRRLRAWTEANKRKEHGAAPV